MPTCRPVRPPTFCPRMLRVVGIAIVLAGQLLWTGVLAAHDASHVVERAAGDVSRCSCDDHGQPAGDSDAPGGCDACIYLAAVGHVVGFSPFLIAVSAGELPAGRVAEVAVSAGSLSLPLPQARGPPV